MAVQGPDIYAHWRDSALTPRFFTIDARAAFVVLFFMIRPHWYTFFMVLFVLAFLSLLNYYNISLVASIRVLRGFLAGHQKIIMRRH